jgi:hypothetical protein
MIGAYALEREPDLGGPRRLAKNAGGGEVRIHGMGGQIHQSDTIAKPEPRSPPRG